MNTIRKSTYEYIRDNIQFLVVDILGGKINNRTENHDKDGYLQFSLKNKMVRSHHIISYLIFGERMIGKQINHIDGNKENNKPTNLELATPSDNVRHAFNNGLKEAKKGIDSTSSKLTETDVVNIRKLRSEGKTLLTIAEIYNMSFQQISRICSGERWGHIPLEMDADLADMTFEKYERLAQRTANKDLGSFEQVSNYALGLVSEAAEVTDQVKKELFHGHSPNRDKIKDELSDVMWYISNLAGMYDIGLKEIAVHNIEKLKKRYPNGFSESASINRVE